MKEICKFKRGFEKRLEDVSQFLETKVGEKIKNNRQLQICIRGNYINVYWLGCSILKYTPGATKNKFAIHYKYIDKDLHIDRKNPYVLLAEKKDDLVYEGKWSFVDNILEPAEKEDIRTLSIYVSDEKKALARYLSEMNSSFVMDLEVAFSRQRDGEEMKGKTRDTVADRIDMARIVMKNGNPLLQLVEVKLAKDTRLRSENGQPEILKQMDRYRNFLKDNNEDIIKSYKTVAGNYIELGVADQMNGFGDKTACEILKAFSKDPKLDPNPYLLVLGEEKNMKGKLNHWDKLKELLEKGNYPMPEIRSI